MNQKCPSNHCAMFGTYNRSFRVGLPNAYKLMCFDKNINGNSDVKFL